jgi:hypothetical protein
MQNVQVEHDTLATENQNENHEGDGNEPAERPARSFSFPIRREPVRRFRPGR